jgi:hypothetical protein
VLSLAVSGANIFAGTANAGVFKSTDGGANWSPVDSGLTSNSVLSLAVCGGSLVAGTSYGNGIFRTADMGKSWKAANAGLTDTHILCLLASGKSLFAGTDCGGVFRSDDSGATWAPANSGLTKHYISSLSVSAASIYAGTDGGVFLSTNGGAMWTPVNSGLADADVLSLGVSDGNLLAGTTFGGVWRLPLDKLSIDEHRQSAPLQPSLKIRCSNQPKSVAVVDFALASEEATSIKVYDQSGRLISSLLEKRLGSGEHRVLWDAGRIANGCYTITMIAGSDAKAEVFRLFR